MKVKELREILKNMNGELEVCVEDSEYGYTDSRFAREDYIVRGYLDGELFIVSEGLEGYDEEEAKKKFSDIEKEKICLISW